MPKRKSSELKDLLVLKKKLKLLEEKLGKPRGRRRIRVIEDSSSSSEVSRNCSPAPENQQDGDTLDSREPLVEPPAETQGTPALEDAVLQGPDENPSVQEESNQEEAPASDTALDSIILDILGEDPAATTEYGREVHDQLVSRFEHFATNGLTKEARKDLADKYLVPSNCTQIGAPMLNAEIKAALPENLVKRDRAIEARQKLLAKAISSLAITMTDLLNSTDRNQELLKKLMDTARLLCDIQHAESITRRNFALFSVKKDLKEHLINTKIDKYLFGVNLSEALKTAKAVCKSGTDLKYNSDYKGPAGSSSQQPPARHLNWKPPVPARRQQGPQGSREPAPRSRSPRRQPPGSSKPWQRQFRANRRY